MDNEEKLLRFRYTSKPSLYICWALKTLSMRCKDNTGNYNSYLTLSFENIYLLVEMSPSVGMDTSLLEYWPTQACLYHWLLGWIIRGVERWQACGLYSFYQRHIQILLFIRIKELLICWFWQNSAEWSWVGGNSALSTSYHFKEKENPSGNEE